jgi:hypothetical protein
LTSIPLSFSNSTSLIPRRIPTRGWPFWYSKELRAAIA